MSAKAFILTIRSFLNENFFISNRRKIARVIKRSRGLLSAMFAPMSVRDFRLLFCGQLVSQLGDMFYNVALPWFLLTSGGGAAALSTVLVAYGIPRIFSPLLGGTLSDRLHPRRVMLVTDSIRALLVGVLALLVAMGHPPLWLLCLIMVILGTCSGLFLPASFSILPEILPTDTLQVGNAFNATSVQLATLIGPALAGLVVSYFQPATGLTIDAFSFVVSAVSLMLMHQSRITHVQKNTSEQAEQIDFLSEKTEAAYSTNDSATLTFIIQQKFPRHLLGRISGAFTTCEFSLQPISIALSGVIVAHWGSVPVFLINGILGLLCLSFALIQREIREM
ncbi:MAG TPA: MFS transporter [Ktedonobacteraceae bacterium]|nr:MFS transporter [Ktedonobacteraceae bacterium]